MGQEVGSFRKKRAFQHEFKAVKKLFYKAASLSVMGNIEVDLIMRLDQIENYDARQLAIQLCLWGEPLDTPNMRSIKNLLGKKELFSSIHHIQLQGFGSDQIEKNGEVLFRFYPRGVDLQKEEECYITLSNNTSHEMHQFSLMDISPKMEPLYNQNSIPETIKQLAEKNGATKKTTLF